MINIYFVAGVFFTLGLNTFFTQLTDNLVAGVFSVLGGVLSSVLVAWLKHRWDERH